MIHNNYLCKLTAVQSHQRTLSDRERPNSLTACYLQEISVMIKPLDCGGLFTMYEENKGMFCLLRRKHNLKGSRSKSHVWNISPSVPLCHKAVQDHLTTTQHKDPIKLEWSSESQHFKSNSTKVGACNFCCIHLHCIEIWIL